MRTIETTIYKFDELSIEAKETAKRKWYDAEEYDNLSEDLTESAKCLLEMAGIEHTGLKLYYSLSYSQGDGLCMIGNLVKGGNSLKLTHSSRYYYAKSVSMEFIDETGEEVDEIEELKSVYFKICAKLEKEGYGILEYRMTDAEFSELCESNNYEFTEDGKLI